MRRSHHARLRRHPSSHLAVGGKAERDRFGDASRTTQHDAGAIGQRRHLTAQPGSTMASGDGKATIARHPWRQELRNTQQMMAADLNSRDSSICACGVHQAARVLRSLAMCGIYSPAHLAEHDGGEVVAQDINEGPTLEGDAWWSRSDHARCGEREHHAAAAASRAAASALKG